MDSLDFKSKEDWTKEQATGLSQDETGGRRTRKHNVIEESTSTAQQMTAILQALATANGAVSAAVSFSAEEEGFEKPSLVWQRKLRNAMMVLSHLEEPSVQTTRHPSPWTRATGTMCAEEQDLDGDPELLTGGVGEAMLRPLIDDEREGLCRAVSQRHNTFTNGLQYDLRSWEFRTFVPREKVGRTHSPDLARAHLSTGQEPILAKCSSAAVGLQDGGHKARVKRRSAWMLSARACEAKFQVSARM